MRRGTDGSMHDTFILSKGHGGIAQFVVLEKLRILCQDDIDTFCKPQGRLGTHPDYGVPGIEATTGSLGHGLPIGAGMALADKVMSIDRTVYVVISDGELQEGSVWESILLAPDLGLTNLVAVVDQNDFQGLGQISKLHPNFYPVPEKVRAFGWECVEVDGHDSEAVFAAIMSRSVEKPMMVVAHTIKGKGVSFMENVPIWHYRSPSPEEYAIAMRELGGVEL